jgi:hypothetical protein
MRRGLYTTVAEKCLVEMQGRIAPPSVFRFCKHSGNVVIWHLQFIPYSSWLSGQPTVFGCAPNCLYLILGICYRYLLLGGLRWLSRYSYSLRARRSGDRIPVGARFARTRVDRPWGPPSPSNNGYRVSFLGIKQPGRGVNHPPPSSPKFRDLLYSTLPSPPSPLPLDLYGLF